MTTTGETKLNFQRSIHAPDGIHDADLRANDIPMTLKDKLYLADIVLCFLFEQHPFLLWG